MSCLCAIPLCFRGSGGAITGSALRRGGITQGLSHSNARRRYPAIRRKRHPGAGYFDLILDSVTEPVRPRACRREYFDGVLYAPEIKPASPTVARAAATYTQ